MGELLIFGDDMIKTGLVIAHQIHFIYRQNHVANAHQRHDKAVPPGLGHHAFTGIHQNNRDFRGRGTGGHIPGVLFMAGGVGSNEFTLIGLKKR